VRHNINTSIRLAGPRGVAALRPHVKTHKLPQVLKMQMERGIRSFKCSTIAELRMVLEAGVDDVLLAYQPVGPALDALIELIQLYPRASISTLADNAKTIDQMNTAAREDGVLLQVYLDCNVGMNRTGIEVMADGDLEHAAALYASIHAAPHLQVAGLHAYEGHLRGTDESKLITQLQDCMMPMMRLMHALSQDSLPVPQFITSGTATSHLMQLWYHQLPGCELLPPLQVGAGTTIFFDAVQYQLCPSLPFQPAATLLTRVVSRPSDQLVCIDLGHKAVASEMPQPRIVLPQVPDARFVKHSEEHLVMETGDARSLEVGTELIAIPMHVCPTIALHRHVYPVVDDVAQAPWRVTPRQPF
ncbi:MAG: alanine racemase, partial [Planctomycetota bacterium]